MTWRNFHLFATVVWTVLLVPTLLWWRESIFWIIAMSWYAIAIGHVSAWQAARVEDMMTPDDTGERCPACGHIDEN